MAQFNFPKIKWNEDVFHRLLGTMKSAVERHDYDSGWVPTPADKVFEHNMTVLPAVVHVQTSDDPAGTNFQNDGYSAVNSSTITVTGTKAYTRVLLNK